VLRFAGWRWRNAARVIVGAPTTAAACAFHLSMTS
jgi:hypothetical protein